MMTGKSVKDIDRYQAVLNSLLALEENKFCADCESKGPRWASWNLGIFICIRCAGIHRNLGVHISKVKSVNLDQWTQEQIQCVQEMGNAKARRLYEAFLPECFQRPETDQSAEIFIRDKYDRKKYMDKVIDIQMLRKEKSCDNIPKEPVVFEKMKLKKEPSPRTQSPSVTDLLGLDGPSPSPTVSNGAASLSEDKGSPAAAALDLFSPLPGSSSASAIQTAPVSSFMPRVAASVPDNLSLFLDPAAKAEEGTVKKLSKDSILSLYASAPSVSAHAGLYMNQMGYPSHPYGSYHHSLAQAAAGGAMGGTMMASQMAMAGAQQQQQGGMMAAVPQSTMMMGGQVPPVIPGMVHQGMMGVQQSCMLGQQQQQGMLGQQQQGMLGQQQLGGLGVPHHQQHGYGVQQSQQLQWNIAQMTQHVAGMNFYGANTNAMNGYSGQQHMGAQTPQNPTQMAAQVWK